MRAATGSRSAAALRATPPRDPAADHQALSDQYINQHEVGPLQAVALGPTEAVVLTGELVGDRGQAQVVQVAAQLLVDGVGHQDATSASCA
jgi:hypothetical protein